MKIIEMKDTILKIDDCANCPCIFIDYDFDDARCQALGSEVLYCAYTKTFPENCPLKEYIEKE